MQKNRSNQHLTFISNNTLAYTLMTISCLFWVGGYVFSNENKIHPVQTNFARSLFIIIFAYAFCKFSDSSIQFKDPKDFKLLLVRSSILILHGITMAGVQFYLPIPIVHTLSCTGALFVFAIQYFYGGVKITRQQGISVLIAFSGILLTVNGRQLYKIIDPNYQFESSFQNYASDSYSSYLIAVSILVMNMALWACAVYMTQSVHFNGYQTSLHFGMVNFIFSSIAYCMLQNKSPALLLHKSYVWTGIPLGLGQLLFTCSLSICQNVGLVSIVGYSTVVIGYFISIVKYSEGLNIFCLLGTIFVIGGVVKITFQKSRNTLEDQAHTNLSKTDVFLHQIKETDH